MNAKTDKWESYTDNAGRQHWRWPARGEGQKGADSSHVGTRQPGGVGLPRQFQAQAVPLRSRGK